MTRTTLILRSLRFHARTHLGTLLGAAIGAFSRWAVDQQEQTLVADYDLDERAAGRRG